MLKPRALPLPKGSNPRTDGASLCKECFWAVPLQVLGICRGPIRLNLPLLLVRTPLPCHLYLGLFPHKRANISLGFIAGALILLNKAPILYLILWAEPLLHPTGMLACLNLSRAVSTEGLFPRRTLSVRPTTFITVSSPLHYAEVRVLLLYCDVLTWG